VINVCVLHVDVVPNCACSNYLCNVSILVDLNAPDREQCARRNCGKNVLQQLMSNHCVCAHDLFHSLLNEAEDSRRLVWSPASSPRNKLSSVILEHPLNAFFMIRRFQTTWTAINDAVFDVNASNGYFSLIHLFFSFFQASVL